MGIEKSSSSLLGGFEGSVFMRYPLPAIRLGVVKAGSSLVNKEMNFFDFLLVAVVGWLSLTPFLPRGSAKS